MLSALAFLVFAVGCSALAFVRHPIWAFYFYLGATYVFPPGRWWGYMFGGTRWSLISAGVCILAIALHRGKLAPKPSWLASVPAIVMVLYALWMWIQTPWAQGTEDHLTGTVQYTKYVLAFWFAYRVADTKEHARDLLFAHMLGCALLGVFAHLMGRSGDRLDGVGGPGMDDANTLGMYLATGAATALGLLLTEKGWRRWMAVGSAAIICQGLVLANTRGAFLGLVGGCVVVMLFKAREHRRMFWALAIVGLVGFAAIIDQAFIDRMLTIKDSTVDSEDVDQSARSRIIVARAQWEMFLDHPMGSGHRGTAVLSPRYLDNRWLVQDEIGGAGRASHNTFLTTLAEQGVPGALLYIWLTLWTLLAGARMRWKAGPDRDPQLTTLAAASVGALAVVFVAGYTADFLMAEVQFWMFAVLVSLQRLAEPQEAPPPAARAMPPAKAVAAARRAHVTASR
jgi:hypothetical protein